MTAPLVIFWVCKKCGKIANTPEGKTPTQETECVSEFQIHDWHPVAVKFGEA